MTVEQFEKAVLANGMTPIHMFMRRGRHVIWCVCLQERTDLLDHLVVYDHRGYAWLTSTYKEEELYIVSDREGVWVNGRKAQRSPMFDLPEVPVQRMSDILLHRAAKDEIAVHHEIAEVVARVIQRLTLLPDGQDRVQVFAALVQQNVYRLPKSVRP